MSTGALGCRTRRSPSGSSVSRRRCGSVGRCGATTTGLSTAVTYQLSETICSPRPISQPRPPILVGGSGERKTLRLVARYADACNLFASNIEEVAHKLDVLRRHCDTEDRDSVTVERTILYVRDPLQDVESFLAEMADYARLGVSTVDLMPTGDPVGFVEQVGKEIIPRLAELEPA